MKTYAEWEATQTISSCSPDAWWAEQGWNAAMRAISAFAKTEVHAGVVATVAEDSVTDLEESK